MNKSRPKQVMFRMNEMEYYALQRRVEESGMSQQEYIVKTLTGSDTFDLKLKISGLETKNTVLQARNQILESDDKMNKSIITRKDRDIERYRLHIGILSETIDYIASKMAEIKYSYNSALSENWDLEEKNKELVAKNEELTTSNQRLNEILPEEALFPSVPVSMPLTYADSGKGYGYE